MKSLANRRALAWILIGYAAFVAPTFLIYLLVTFGTIAIASVLCGVAVIMAVILAFKILPLVHRNG